MTTAFLGEASSDPSSRSPAGIVMAGIINIELFCGGSHEKCDWTLGLLSFHSQNDYSACLILRDPSQIALNQSICFEFTYRQAVCFCNAISSFCDSKDVRRLIWVMMCRWILTAELEVFQKWVFLRCCRESKVTKMKAKHLWYCGL